MSQIEKDTPGSSIQTPVSGNRLASDDFWIKDPFTIRRFQDQQLHYVELGAEVAYTLNKLLSITNTKVAAVTHRAKDLKSFLEKIGRKSYTDPFEQITDFAGVRVVCYYSDQLPKVGNLIDKEFDVISKEDKTEAAGLDKFGYGGTHYIVRLGPEAAGTRYEDLKGKVCEIQVRTVMQDAWAVFSHHLMYKHENEVPDTLKRQINALAGALESADLNCQVIRDKRDEYIRSVDASVEKANLAGVANNRDSLKEYLSHRFPGRPDISSPFYLPDWVYQVYPTLQHVKGLLDRTEKARDWYVEQVQIERGIKRERCPSEWELMSAIYITDKEQRHMLVMNPGGFEKARLLSEASKLLE